MVSVRLKHGCVERISPRRIHANAGRALPALDSAGTGRGIVGQIQSMRAGQGTSGLPEPVAVHALAGADAGLDRTSECQTEGRQARRSVGESAIAGPAAV